MAVPKVVNLRTAIGAGATRRLQGVIGAKSASLIFLGLLFAADGLDAFQILGFPLRRLLHFVAFAIGVFVLLRFAPPWAGKSAGRPARILTWAGGIGACVMLYAVGLTVVLLIQAPEPAGVLFVLKRLVHWGMLSMAFVMALIVCRSFDVSDGFAISRLIVTIGVFFSVIAVTDYLLVACGYDLLPRNAAGTDHGQIVNRFDYYGFYRAMGTLREPSLMAAYLLPFLFFALGTRAYLAAVLIGVALCLSLSILAWTGSVVAFSLSAALLHSRARRRLLMSGGIALISAFAIGNLLVFPYGDEGGSYLLHRYRLIVSAIDSGTVAGGAKIDDVLECPSLDEDLRVAASSADAVRGASLHVKFLQAMQSLVALPGRGFVFCYVYSEGGFWIGKGLGLASLELGRFLGSTKPASFLSFPFSVYASAGGVGAILATLAIVMCLWGGALSARQSGAESARPQAALTAVLAIIVSWVLILEEPSISSAAFLAVFVVWASRVQPTGAGSEEQPGEGAI